MPYFAQAAVDSATIHFDKLYTYLVPEPLAEAVHPGSLVLVPFGRGNHPRMAVVLECTQQPEVPPRTKTVLDAAPDEARLTPDLLRLVYLLKERAFCTYYEAVKAIIPYGAQYRMAQSEDGTPRLQSQMERATENWYIAENAPEEAVRLGPKQKLALQLLQRHSMSETALETAGIHRAVLKGLLEKALIRQEKRWKAIDLYSEIPLQPEQIALTEEQQAAYEALMPAIEQGRGAAALLHGVTGSGKTLVFFKLIEQVLARGKTVMVLVPEISLTPQMILRLKKNFGKRVAVQHSALNHTERLLQWKMIQQGCVDIVVGTRSAVFTPLKNLGLIIMDEEQEHTYRSESSPRYDAHEIARWRAAYSNALVLFASATPSVESYYAAKTGRYQLVQMHRRYGGNPLPAVKLVDMRAELMRGNAGEISVELAQELQKNLLQGEQSILLLNRRGYRTVCACQDCGHVIKCQSCSVPMVYHKAQGHLMCHYCGKTLPLPSRCPQCGGTLRYTGFGTQKAEEELERLLPKARILRMDQDSTMTKNSHEKMLAAFAAGEYDILLGTQMVAKGLDFAKVSLVGVLGIDNLLFGQGFRAYENVFSLLTQVVGRGGRAELPGRALIQTTNPEHPVLQMAATQNYEAFFAQEIAFRKACLYPPFCAVCMVGFVGSNEASVVQAARQFSAILAQKAAKVPGVPLRVLGPAPYSVVMVNNKFRYKLTIKCRNDKAFRALIGAVIEEYGNQGLAAKARVAVDMNSDGER